MILTNQSTVSWWIWTNESAPLCWDDQTRIWSADFYVFTPLVGPVRLPILVDIENEGSSIAFIHRDLLAPVRTHHRSGHQGETAEILPCSGVESSSWADWFQVKFNADLAQVSLTARRNWKSSWCSSRVSILNDKLYCRLHRRSVWQKKLHLAFNSGDLKFTF